MSPRTRLALTAIVVLALVVRAASLTWGLPDDATHFFPFHPDELKNVSDPRHMVLAGTLRPRFYNYGSLFSYLCALAYVPCSWLGLLDDRAAWFLVARLVTLLCGVLSVPLVFAIGRRVGGTPVALAAAGLFAVAPGHVMHSSFATVDAPSILFALACTWWSLRFLDTEARRHLFAAASMAGLAAATKYPIGMVGLSALAAALLVHRRDARALVADVAPLASGATAGFLLGCPYAVLDFPAFWNDLRFELFEHAFDGHKGLFAATGNGWWFGLTTNLPYAVGPIVLLACLPGAVLLLRRAPRPAIVLLAFAVPYFLLLGAIQLRFVRYTLALTPLMCMAASLALLRFKPALLAAAIPCVLQVLAFQRPDARLEARAAVFAEAPHGSRVAMLTWPQWYTPPLSKGNAGKPARRYDRDQQERYSFAVPKKYTARALRKLDAEWLVLGEYEWRDIYRRSPEVARCLAVEYELRHDYTAFPESWRWVFGNPVPPHDWLYPFPRIRVWRRRIRG